MHVNPIAARRLITGKQIVHGIHVLLTGIEYWQNDSDLLPVSVSCTFNNPISVEDNVLFSQRCRRGQEFVIEATVSELVCARIVIASSPTKDKTRLSLALGENACSADEIMIDRLSDPLDEAADAHGNRVYVIKLGEADFSRQFPRSYRYFGQRRIAAILSLSYLSEWSVRVCTPYFPLSISL